MRFSTDITIVGAGPYGLSIASHLQASKANYRIIGTPMDSWLNKMPKGMLLKSEGIQSSLYAPDNAFSLSRFCKDQGIPFHNLNLPVSLETFTAYCLAFQKRFVPNVEDKQLVELKRIPGGFQLTMDDGSTFSSRKVVLATGYAAYRQVPQQLAHLPQEHFTHSADHADFTRFRGRKVAVIGGNSSAIETATLLHEQGAHVQLIARKSSTNYAPVDIPQRSVTRAVLEPFSGIGSGRQGLLWSDLPWICRHSVRKFKITQAKKWLGIDMGKSVKERFAKVSQLLGYHVVKAETIGDGVALVITDKAGNQQQVEADHVIAATGYIPDVRRLTFLGSEILGQLQLNGSCPALSLHFESSVPGLYFVGAASADSFGSIMRFVTGAEFTSQRIVRDLI